MKEHKGLDYSSFGEKDLKKQLHDINRTIKEISKPNVIFTRQRKAEYLDWLYMERYRIKKEIKSRKKPFLEQLLSCKKDKSPIS